VGLADDAGPGAVGLDTSAFIYYIEDDPRYAPLLEPIFSRAGRDATVVTSAMTLLELLVVPIRHGQAKLADRYDQLLTRSRGVRLVDVTRDQLRAAASLRAVLRLKTPDALQVVAATSAGCKVFITNDRRLPAVPGLRVIQLSDYA
jgi:predicted nucleic acid-binding protein